MEVAQDAEEDEHTEADDVVDAGLLHAVEDVVRKLFAVPPGENVGAEAVVGETLGVVGERVFGGCERDVVGFGRGVWDGDFVGMVLECAVQVISMDDPTSSRGRLVTDGSTYSLRNLELIALSPQSCGTPSSE